MTMMPTIVPIAPTICQSIVMYAALYYRIFIGACQLLRFSDLSRLLLL